jgi:hypothetical protein
MAAAQHIDWPLDSAGWCTAGVLMAATVGCLATAACVAFLAPAAIANVCMGLLML